MICQRCGNQIDTRRLNPDGTLTCPFCGLVYAQTPGPAVSQAPQQPQGQVPYSDQQNTGAQQAYRRRRAYEGQQESAGQQGYGDQPVYGTRQAYGGQQMQGNMQGFGEQQGTRRRRAYEGDQQVPVSQPGNMPQQGYAGPQGYTGQQVYTGQQGYAGPQGYSAPKAPGSAQPGQEKKTSALTKRIGGKVPVWTLIAAILVIALILVLLLTGVLGGGSGGKSGSSGGKTASSGLQNATTKVGSIVKFGSYEQDNNLDNGPEPIEWIVLEIQDGRALLLSRYGLECMPFHTEYKAINWRRCSLRAWLNNDFLNQAFSETEQKSILTTWVDNSPAQGNSEYDSVGGNTQDRVFLLSYAEAKQYLGAAFYEENNIEENEKSRVAPTDYAIARGAWISDYENERTADGKPAGGWWLRSSGWSQEDAGIIRSSGLPDSSRVDSINYDNGIVRPALWMNLDPSSNPGIVNASLGEKAVPSAPAANKTSCGTVGNVVTFGSYEQDDSPDNGPEAIEWIVMDVQDGKALLLSKYGLDTKPYNMESVEVTWETCTLRAWLNNDFLNAAFSGDEQRAILVTRVDNSEKDGWNTTGGNDTDDRVFLLNKAEAKQYLGAEDYGDSIIARAAATTYAILEGTRPNNEYQTESGEPAVGWWLRGPGVYQSYAASIWASGNTTPHRQAQTNETVRPAIWLDLNSDIF